MRMFKRCLLGLLAVCLLIGTLFAATLLHPLSVRDCAVRFAPATKAQLAQAKKQYDHVAQGDAFFLKPDAQVYGKGEDGMVFPSDDPAAYTMVQLTLTVKNNTFFPATITKTNIGLTRIGSRCIYKYPTGRQTVLPPLKQQLLSETVTFLIYSRDDSAEALLEGVRGLLLTLHFDLPAGPFLPLGRHQIFKLETAWLGGE